MQPPLHLNFHTAFELRSVKEESQLIRLSQAQFSTSPHAALACYVCCNGKVRTLLLQLRSPLAWILSLRSSRYNYVLLSTLITFFFLLTFLTSWRCFFRQYEICVSVRREKIIIRYALVRKKITICVCGYQKELKNDIKSNIKI